MCQFSDKVSQISIIVHKNGDDPNDGTISIALFWSAERVFCVAFLVGSLTAPKGPAALEGSSSSSPKKGGKGNGAKEGAGAANAAEAKKIIEEDAASGESPQATSLLARMSMFQLNMTTDPYEEFQGGQFRDHHFFEHLAEHDRYDPTDEQVFPSDMEIQAVHLNHQLFREAIHERQITLKIYWLEGYLAVDFLDLGFVNCADVLQDFFQYLGSRSLRLRFDFSSVALSELVVNGAPEEKPSFFTFLLNAPPKLYHRRTFTTSLKNPWLPIDSPTSFGFPGTQINAVSVTLPPWSGSRSTGPTRNRHLLKRLLQNLPPLYNPELKGVTRNTMSATKTAQGDVLYLQKVEFLGEPIKPTAAKGAKGGKGKEKEKHEGEGGVPDASSEPEPAAGQEEDKTTSTADETGTPHQWNWDTDVLSADTFLAHLAKKSGGKSTLKAAKESFAILYELIYTSHLYPEFSWFQPDTSRLFPPSEEAAARLLKRASPQQQAGRSKLIRSFIASGEESGPTLPPIPVLFSQKDGKTREHRRCAYCLTREEALPAVPAATLGGEAKPAKLQGCSQCKKVAYCSKECQKLDWKEIHKAECKRE